MHTVLLTTDPVPALQHLPGGGRLYVTPTLTQQLRGQLVQALELLYADSSDKSAPPDAAGAQQAEAGRRRPRQHDAAASTTADATVAAAVAPKRARHADDDTQQQPSQLPVTPPQGGQQQHQQGQQMQDIINFQVQDRMGGEVHFRAKLCTKVALIMKAYCYTLGWHQPDVRFFNSALERMLDGFKLEDCAIEDGDTIYAILVQTGC
jgi:hypothetical protein